jgi:hypothetical protein
MGYMLIHDIRKYIYNTIYVLNILWITCYEIQLVEQEFLHYFHLFITLYFLYVINENIISLLIILLENKFV